MSPVPSEEPKGFIAKPNDKLGGEGLPNHVTDVTRELISLQCSCRYGFKVKLAKLGNWLPTSSCITLRYQNFAPHTNDGYLVTKLLWLQVKRRTQTSFWLLPYHLETKRKILLVRCDEVVLFGQTLLCLDIHSCCTPIFPGLFWRFSTLVVAFFVEKP